MTVIAYLAAAVVANLVAARYGPSATVPSAFVLIGLSLTARDVLHERWRGRLRLRMGGLIIAASVLSWLLNPASERIAVASALAFLASETVDALVYQGALRRDWSVKANASNVAGAAVDSLAFPTLAFGAWLPWIVLAQFGAKVGGGALWTIVLRRRR